MSQKYLSLSQRDDNVDISLEDDSVEESHEIQVETLDFSRMTDADLVKKFELLKKENIFLAEKYSKTSKEVVKEKEI